jgi:hypothetical protein
MHTGEKIAGVGGVWWEVIAQAPTAWVTHVPRHREIEGRIVTGSWSDPWWLYCQVGGWAIARRWKNKAISGWLSTPAIEARDEIVIEQIRDMEELLVEGLTIPHTNGGFRA